MVPVAVPDGEHAERLREVLDRHLGAQLVEFQPVGRAWQSARGQSRKKPPPSSGGASATMKSERIFPCGVRSARKAGRPG